MTTERQSSRAVRRALAAALVASGLALGACGSSNDKADCLVLYNGSEVCGGRAAAWCEMTDPARSDAFNDGDLSDALDQSQQDCDAIRKEYR